MIHKKLNSQACSQQAKALGERATKLKLSTHVVVVFPCRILRKHSPKLQQHRFAGIQTEAAVTGKGLKVVKGLEVRPFGLYRLSNKRQPALHTPEAPSPQSEIDKKLVRESRSYKINVLLI